MQSRILPILGRWAAMQCLDGSVQGVYMGVRMTFGGTMSLIGFKRHLGLSGCEPHGAMEIVADDKIHRYRLHDDKPGRVNGAYQVKEEADGFVVGWCKDWKTGERHTYMSAAKRGASAAERAENAARREAARQERIRQEALDLAAARDRAARLWDLCSEASPENEYLMAKGVSAGPAREYKGVLVVPVYVGGELTSLQYIPADGGQKRFLKGRGSTDGGYCVWEGEGDTIYICEGFATAGTVSAATGCTVVIAFNAGNLGKVAEMVVGWGSGERVVICADNDLNGDQSEITAKTNPGRFWANQAAARAGGLQVVWPEVPSDFNDMAKALGLDAVREALQGVPYVEPMEPYFDGFDPSAEEEVKSDNPALRDALDKLARPLGYDVGQYYFLPRVTGQVVKLKPTEMSSLNNLYQIGNQFDWLRICATDKPGEITSIATPELMSLCHARGVYTQDIVRGAGAWPNGKSAVVNLGDSVYDCATGETVGHNDMRGKEVYVRSNSVYDLSKPPLRNADAYKLRQICDKLTWRRKMDGTLLAGWLVLAPVGGALAWRPHIFITGSKGAGKSTVINDVVMRVVDRMAIKMDGGSTEAGLRQAVRESTRPVIMDEFEGENRRDAEQVDKILNWARKGSSGGAIVNANGYFRARSCVCFAAINPLVIKDADKERNTLLELVPNRSSDAEKHYAELMDMIHETLTEDFAAGLVRRTVENMDVLLHNCQVFIKYTTRVLGSKRAGDQVGTLLAGAYMLNSTTKVTEAKAAEWVNAQDWSWHDDEVEGSDTENLMQYIMTAMVEHTSADRTGKMPIAELVLRAHHKSMGWEDAVKTLGRYGLAVVDGWLRVANKSNRLSEVLANTIYQVYKPTLSRYPGVRSGADPMRFAPGVNSRYQEIPLSGFMDGVVVSGEEELPISSDDMEGFQ